MGDVVAERIVRKADEIRQTHARCASLTAPCKEDCPCWFEAADAEADRYMRMSDFEIRSAIILDGDDPDEVAAKARNIIRLAIANHGGRHA
jgi:hypothetical protein